MQDVRNLLNEGMVLEASQINEQFCVCNEQTDKRDHYSFKLLRPPKGESHSQHRKILASRAGSISGLLVL
jgi:hypothetical protein